MQRRSVVPFLMLGLLTVLAVGGAILGLSLAPNSTDLIVHNGAGETLAASQLSALYTSTSTKAVIRIDYRAPNYGKETLVSGGPAKTKGASRTLHGSSAKSLLEPVTEILDITGFVKKGSVYVGSEPASKLVPASEANLVTGALKATVTVINGYVVTVSERIHLGTPGGTTNEGTGYRITEVDNWKVPTS